MLPARQRATMRPDRLPALAIVIAAIAVAATGIGMTIHALMIERPTAPSVRPLQGSELPDGIPAVLQPDAIASKPVIGLLDSLRRMNHKPAAIDWIHFRCVESATVLSAEPPTADHIAFRSSLLAAFPTSWTRNAGKDAVDYLRSPDGTIEIAMLADAEGRDAVDQLAASLRPSRVVALAYRLQPC